MQQLNMETRRSLFQEGIHKEVDVLMNIKNILDHIIHNDSFSLIYDAFDQILRKEIVFNTSGCLTRAEQEAAHPRRHLLLQVRAQQKHLRLQGEPQVSEHVHQ